MVWSRDGPGAGSVGPGLWTRGVFPAAFQASRLLGCSLGPRAWLVRAFWPVSVPFPGFWASPFSWSWLWPSLRPLPHSRVPRSSPREPWSGKHTLLECGSQGSKAKLLYKKWTTNAREPLLQHLVGRHLGLYLSTPNQPASDLVYVSGEKALYTVFTQSFKILLMTLLQDSDGWGRRAQRGISPGPPLSLIS